MRFDHVLAVARADWSALARSGIGWKLCFAHLSLVAAAVLFTWPTWSTAGRPTTPVTWHWFFYTEAVCLAYAALALTSRRLQAPGMLSASDWVAHGVSDPVSVLGGKGVAVAGTLLFLGFSAAPFGLWAHATYPLPGWALAASVALLIPLVGCLAFLGLAIGVAVQERTARIFATDALFALTILLSIAFASRFDYPTGGALAALNPLAVWKHLMKAQALPSYPSGLPWALWCAASLALLFAAGSIAYSRLAQLARDREKGGQAS